MFGTQFRLGRGRYATSVEHARHPADAVGSFHSAKRRIGIFRAVPRVDAKYERHYSNLYSSLYSGLYSSLSGCERRRPAHADYREHFTGPAAPCRRYNSQSCRDASQRLCSHRGALLLVIVVDDVDEHGPAQECASRSGRQSGRPRETRERAVGQPAARKSLQNLIQNQTGGPAASSSSSGSSARRRQLQQSGPVRDEPASECGGQAGQSGNVAACPCAFGAQDRVGAELWEEVRFSRPRPRQRHAFCSDGGVRADAERNRRGCVAEWQDDDDVFVGRNSCCVSECRRSEIGPGGAKEDAAADDREPPQRVRLVQISTHV